MAGAGDGAEREWLATLAEEVERADSAQYRVVAAALRAVIASGQVPVGARLPPQRELARLLGVGRRTIVEALNLLRAEALIHSQHGAGTWVVRRPEGTAGFCSRR